MRGALNILSRLLRICIYSIALLIFTLVLYFSSYLPNTITRIFYHRLTRFWCFIFVRALGVDLRLIHKNTKPLPEHYILIANHPSSLEDFGVASLFNIFPLAKKGVRNWLFIGRISERAGTIFFDRKDKGSRRSAIGTMTAALNDGKNVVLFPEGGCLGKRIYKLFHTGAFDVAMRTGLPIIPLFLHYEDQDAFAWLDESLLSNFWSIMTAKSNRANYYVYDAIDPSGYTDKFEFANDVHALYLDRQKVHLD